MNLAERIDSLKAKHAALDAAIHDEETRPLPDVARLHDLKRQKLKIKDEIEFMTRH
ncbi:MAG TPA: YdcH family protein [Alphaproteobacteria bacterium]|nr:YdcH family protein [Alphaproteobacteria bacterium]